MPATPAPAFDFFISYTSSDKGWAEWIAWQIKQSGRSVRIQAWHWNPGNDWVTEIQNNLKTCARMIAVLSPDYLKSAHGQAEWNVFYAKDADGTKGLLVPVRVARCELENLHRTRSYIDFVGNDEATCLRDLLQGIDPHEPTVAPVFPVVQPAAPLPIGSLNPGEAAILGTLTHARQPISVEAIAEISGVQLNDARRTLKILANRSLVVPDQREMDYAIVPLVADFLGLYWREVVTQTGHSFTDRAYTLINENGYREHGGQTRTLDRTRYPVLDAAWSTVAPALPLLLAGPNVRLQTACDALADFLKVTGRWDELLSLSQEAEAKALLASDHFKAGWRAYQAGWVHWLRQQSDEVLACADRAERHWQRAQTGSRERSLAIRRRGQGHQLNEDFSAAITAFREALDLRFTLGVESPGVAMSLNDLANAERLSGDLTAAARDYGEALRMARAVDYADGVANSTGNLADVALDRKDWPGAETLAIEALALSEKLGQPRWVGSNCHRLAKALARQGKPAEALPLARRAVEIYTALRLPNLDKAWETLRECES